MYLKFLIPIWFLIPLIQCGEREEQKKMKSQGEILGNRYAFLLFEDNESCKIVYKQEHLLVQKLQDLRKLLVETKEKLLSQKEKKLNEIVNVSKGNVQLLIHFLNHHKYIFIQLFKVVCLHLWYEVQLFVYINSMNFQLFVYISTLILHTPSYGNSVQYRN